MSYLPANVSAALLEYLNANSLIPVTDPWTRLMDGYLVKVHIHRWMGQVSITHEDLGLPKRVEGARDTSFLKEGRFFLLDETIAGGLGTIQSLVRAMAKKYSVQMHWGQFIPASAIPAFKRDFAAYKEKFDAIVDDLENNYDRYRDNAIDKIAAIAERAWIIRNRIGADEKMTEEDDGSMDYYKAYKVQQFMADFPKRGDLRDRFRIFYDMSYIPMPTMIAEQQAQVEMIEAAKADALERRRMELAQDKLMDEMERLQLMASITEEQAMQQEKIRVVAEYRAELEVQLKEQAAATLSAFETTLAAELRQRLFESLTLAIEGIKAGKYKPQTGRSLRVIIDQIGTMVRSEDSEMRQMLKRLRSELGEAGDGTFSVESTGQLIQDYAALLNTSLVMLGQSPRVPDRMSNDRAAIMADIPTLDSLESVQAVRRRAGLTVSLAESLIGAQEDEQPEAIEAPAPRVRRRQPATL